MQKMQLYLSDEQLAFLEDVACMGIENVSKSALVSVENFVASIAVRIADATLSLDEQDDPPIGYTISLTPLLPISKNTTPKNSGTRSY